MFSFVVFFFQRGNISHFHTWGRSHSTRVWLLCRIYCHGLIFFFRVFLRTLWAFSSLIQKIWADDILSEFLLSIITRKQKITSCRSILSTFGEKIFQSAKVQRSHMQLRFFISFVLGSSSKAFSVSVDPPRTGTK